LIVTEDGFAETEKSGAVTVMETVVVCVPLPEIVNVKVPVGVVPPTFVVMVKADVAEPFDAGVMDVGFSAQVVDAGQPPTVRSTALLNPFMDVTVIVEPPELPWVIVSDEGFAESEKSGAGPPQLLNLNDPTRVLQLNAPSDFKYWLMYQKVQSSDGSMRKEL